MRQGVNTSSGVFTGQTDYSAFGEVIGGNNTGASQSVYQWGAQSGYRMDGGSGGGGDCGLVKVGARYYDPAVGRFTSRDSDITQSAYVYCGGDPINHTDPSGHSWLSSIFKGIGKAVIGVFNAVNKALGAVTEAVAGNIATGVKFIIESEFQRALFIALATFVFLPLVVAAGIGAGTATAGVLVYSLAGGSSAYLTATLFSQNTTTPTIIGAVSGVLIGTQSPRR